MKTYTRGPLLMGMICLALSACSSAPKEIDVLEQARSDYSAVSKDATIVKNAPEVLDEARDALDNADARWKGKDDQWRVEHYAYIASQRIETAKLISESKETDANIRDMLQQRQKMTLAQREAELMKVRQEAKALKQQMVALQAEETERGMVLTLGDVLFDVNEASLAPGAARNIAKIATFMRNYPERRAVIEGHTDSMGEADYNLDLSRDRAFAVRNALVNAGIKAQRISTKGLGETMPVANNSSSAGRQENRRVEIIFPDAGSQISQFDDY